MFTRPLVITDVGKSILFRAMQGEAFEFRFFRVGDGTLTATETPETMTSMKHVVTTVGTEYPSKTDGDINLEIPDGQTSPVITGESDNGKYMQLSGKFNNLALPSQFEWKELGLFIRCTNQNAQDHDVDQLYAYGYDNDNPETIKTNEYGVAVEQSFTVIVAIGTAENITVNIAQPDYAPYQDFTEHVNSTGNVHSLTLQDIGAAPELHQHDTTNITTGILPPERGGTGVGSISAFIELLNIGGVIDYFDGSEVNSSTGDVSGEYLHNKKFVFGAFLGDGKAYKKIRLGFMPKVVFLFKMLTGKNTSPIGPLFSFAPGMNLYYGGDGDSYISRTADELFVTKKHGGAVVTDYGFAVGYANGQRNDINVSGSAYFFIAMEGGEPPEPDVPTDVSQLTISQSNYLVYNGSAQSPTFSVKYNGNLLVENVDYTVTYIAQVNAGTYEATITGATGSTISGSVKASWNINRKTVSGAFNVTPTVLKDFHPTNAQVDYPEYTSLTVTCTNAGGGLLSGDYMISIEDRHFFTNGMAIGGKGIIEHYSKRTVINFAYVDSTVTVIQNPYLRVCAYSQNYITEVVTLNLTVA